MEPTARTRGTRFGTFEVDLRSGEVYKHGIRLKLQDQPFQVLAALLEHPGDVVTREELRERLWPADTFVDFETGLNSAIKKLRDVLGDSAEKPRYVETLPRRGYRFIAPVEIAEPSIDSIPMQSQAEAAATSAAEPNPASEVFESGADIVRAGAVDRPRSRQRWTVVGVAVLLLAAVGGYLQWSRARAHAQASEKRMMLAVLPFENLTGDPAQDYFSDGLTEEMIAQLGRLDPDHLGVIARTSVMRYKNSPEQVDQIGRELGVQFVLEGSVRRDTDKVRITTQMIRVKDQTHIWSRQFDRELSHLLALQAEIALEISDELQLALAEPGKSAYVRSTAPLAPASYEAYDLYLEGRYYSNKRTVQGFQQAVERFTRAVAKDPTYARAYAGLADSFALMSAFSVAPPSELIPKARAAALNALELDPKLAEAHVSLALIAQNYDWDWQTSEREFRRAIALDPNYATAHHWYAEHLALQGRFDEAFPEMRRARELDPLSLIIQTDNAVFLYFSRQYDRAIEQFRAVLDVEPAFGRAHMIAFAYVQEGRFTDALADIESRRRIDPGNWVASAEAYAYGREGQPVQARRALKELQLLDRRNRIDPMVFVVPYVGLGDSDHALARLDECLALHSPGLTALRVDPIYDPLRSEPRFQELLRRVGLAQ